MTTRHMELDLRAKLAQLPRDSHAKFWFRQGAEWAADWMHEDLQRQHRGGPPPGLPPGSEQELLALGKDHVAILEYIDTHDCTSLFSQERL